VTDGDFVWVHDYHLMGLGRQLLERGLRNRLGFFLHIPFPPPDIFSKLPWRSNVLQSLLHYDLLGFQTPRDRENFLDCVRRLLPEAHCHRQRGTIDCAVSQRETRIGVFPIGIDYECFAQMAASPATTQRVAELRQQMPGQQIILGLDRLDYTKGIPYRLRAFQLALRRHPELHRQVTLLQVVVPSREAVPEYQELKAQIEQLVSQINGEFTQPGWVPIHHVFRSLEREELVSYYRVADVALVTPLKDGMNLVAKEYCACQVEGNGVLILSEFAGAAVQMQRGAILVNPYDLAHVADAIRRAVTMTRAQRRRPMRRLRNIVRREDVYWWVDRFLGACGLGGPPPRADATVPPEPAAV
jgi:trehalose-6-phosphate synthase